MARNLDRYLPSTRLATAAGIAAAGVIALGGAAAIVSRQAARAERANPPRGSFVTAKGVRLHYVEQGRGPPVVFLHGNGLTVEDMLISGVMDHASQSFRAIAIDRPGFGHSERPSETSWSAAAQASLLPEAFAILGIRRPIVVGHSWGTLMALALALDHPHQVAGLVLASGYYYPTARADVAVFSTTAIPLLGDLLCYTVAPLTGEVLAPRMIKKMFSPQDVPERFDREFPMALMLRPSQIQAASQDAAHMISDAKALSERYNAISCKVAVLAGEADGVVNFKSHAQRLHKELPGSTLDIFPATGHMIHHLDPARVVRAIERVSVSDPLEQKIAV